MSAVRLANRYAKSLLDLAIEQGKLEEVNKDMRYFVGLINESPDFTTMLKSPIINADKKMKIIEAVLKGKVTDMTLKFVRILVRKKREPYLSEIADSFIDQYNDHKNITPVKLKTAIPMDQKYIDQLLEKIKQEAGLENIELTTEVDEELIGGFVLQYEDKLFDASVSKDIDLLRKDLQENKYVRKL